MNDRTKFHLQSLTFALIVLFFALVTNSSDSKTAEVVSASPVSFTATALTTVTGQQDPLSSGAAEPIEVAVGAGALQDRPGDVLVESGSSLPLDLPVSVHAASVLVIEMDTTKPLLEHQSQYRWPLASLTKLMTALIAYEEIGPYQPITVSAEAVEGEGVAGSFSPGEVFSVEDLVHAMIAVSSNDAAMALSEYVGHTAMTDLMQQKAATLGMRETTFIDPTGLSFLNQSTVGDIQTLVTYLYHHHPEILGFAKGASSQIAEMRTGAMRTLGNVNQFAGNPDFVGGKTGTTDEAKQNLVSVFKNNEKNFIIIVLGSEDRFGETTKLYSWLKKQ